ncbi:MAG: hypothetical protein PHE55_10545 [Methylococcaceae bacterium]|nr:hypothetical protein [Methylococcaceae bacterium]
MKPLLYLILLTATTLPVQASENSGPIRKIAEESVSKWNQAIAKGAVDEIGSLYTGDAILIEPHGVVAKGQEIRQFWRALIDSQRGVYTLALLDVSDEKDNTIVARIAMEDTKPLGKSNQVLRYRFNGVLYNVLIRQPDGSWKVQTQRWSEKLGG